MNEINAVGIPSVIDNSCFINTALQCLAVPIKLLHINFHTHFPPLIQLILDITSNSNNRTKIQKFIKTIEKDKKNFPNFNRNEMDDCLGFLTNIIESTKKHSSFYNNFVTNFTPAACNKCGFIFPQTKGNIQTLLSSQQRGLVSLQIQENVLKTLTCVQCHNPIPKSYFEFPLFKILRFSKNDMNINFKLDDTFTIGNLQYKLISVAYSTGFHAYAMCNYQNNWIKCDGSVTRFQGGLSESYIVSRESKYCLGAIYVNINKSSGKRKLSLKHLNIRNSPDECSTIDTINLEKKHDESKSKGTKNLVNTITKVLHSHDSNTEDVEVNNVNSDSSNENDEVNKNFERNLKLFFNLCGVNENYISQINVNEFGIKHYMNLTNTYQIPVYGTRKHIPSDQPFIINVQEYSTPLIEKYNEKYIDIIALYYENCNHSSIEVKLINGNWLSMEKALITQNHLKDALFAICIVNKVQRHFPFF